MRISQAAAAACSVGSGGGVRGASGSAFGRLLAKAAAAVFNGGALLRRWEIATGTGRCIARAPTC